MAKNSHSPVSLPLSSHELLDALSERAVGRMIEACRRRALRALLPITEVRARLLQLTHTSLTYIETGTTVHRPVCFPDTPDRLKDVMDSSGNRGLRTIHVASDAFDELLVIAKASVGSNANVLRAEAWARRHRANINLLVEKNLLLVASLTRYYQVSGALEHCDLIQEGALGLIHAAELWDWRRGLRFSTYAYNWIRHSIRDAYSTKRNVVAVPRTRGGLRKESLQDPATHEISITHRAASGDDYTASELSVEHLVDDSSGPDELVDRLNGAELLTGLLPALPEREQAVISARFGLQNFREHTRMEIARKLGVSKGTAGNIENRALEKLRFLIAH